MPSSRVLSKESVENLEHRFEELDQRFLNRIDDSKNKISTSFQKQDQHFENLEKQRFEEQDLRQETRIEIPKSEVRERLEKFH